MGAQESNPISVSVESTNSIEFEWPLQSVSNIHTYDVGRYIDKHVTLSGSNRYSFNLCLYPHGFNERSKKYVSLWLKKLTTDELFMRFTCSITDGKGRKLFTKKTGRTLALESVLGWPIFCSRCVLFDEGGETLSDNNMTIKGKIEVFESSAILNEETEDDPILRKSLSETSDNFQQLLEDHHFSDFTIRIGDQNLRAHRAILSARSEVFKTMFQSSLHQNLKGIQITDISYEGMEMLLKYIYTGRLGYISVPVGMDVYYAADKYEVLILKYMCSTILAKNLDPDNVIDVLLLAYRHSDLELQESCLSFMDKNLRELKGRSQWIDLMKNYPDLADKALFFSQI